jgi:hypothetical protein
LQVGAQCREGFRVGWEIWGKRKGQSNFFSTVKRDFAWVPTMLPL